METDQTYLKLQLGATRIEFRGDAALLKGGMLDIAKGLDQLQIPKVVDSANTLAMDLEAARAVQDEMREALDSMSEMGEMESLRLQMAMDRLGKMMSTLSNILKKNSDTANGIVQNLK